MRFVNPGRATLVAVFALIAASIVACESDSADGQPEPSVTSGSAGDAGSAAGAGGAGSGGDAGMGGGGTGGASAVECTAAPPIPKCIPAPDASHASGPTCFALKCYAAQPGEVACQKPSLTSDSGLLDRLGVLHGGNFGNCASVDSGPHCGNPGECCYLVSKFYCY